MRVRCNAILLFVLIFFSFSFLLRLKYYLALFLRTFRVVIIELVKDIEFFWAKFIDLAFLGLKAILPLNYLKDLPEPTEVFLRVEGFLFFGEEVCEFFRLSGLLNLVKLLRNVGFYLFKGFTEFLGLG